jgi:hypothetical protein
MVAAQVCHMFLSLYVMKIHTIAYITSNISAWNIDIESLKIHCLRFVVCPLLAQPSKGKLLLFFSFFVAVAIYSTNKANKAGGTGC